MREHLMIDAGMPGIPDGVFAVMKGSLVVRLLLNTTATNREHSVSFEIVDEDGGRIGRIDAKTHVPALPGVPIGWDQGANLVFPLTGLPLPKPGNYTINRMVNDEFLGDRPFRVLKAF